ncbi:MAG: glycoside hydrolase family 92 protein [Bacteroidetes bacterium]|jgi:predicted alpha-1,2-mannosidase|nr:glycoside hydrolase family 92 protein [Bacteroidota bacterium]MBT6687168.1 glycoside hydrolase family 92 protein [Bacteroidota bacterium]MBT7144928.1 glycoside hydrolase family 92 protein [Bacteroidota bacterium]MBT7492981.1 glycoside hydrolase family 92 protein [Bacteroidota bacterium]
MRNITIIIFILLILNSCKNSTQEVDTNLIPRIDYTQYVNPFIGTSKMGHVFPGATAPFGMVQLSPQTNFVEMFQKDGTYNSETYEYCAGYQYRDSIIIGFAHTNFSGTGHSDLGDFLVMPTTGNSILEPLKTKDGNKGFYSTFTHETEEASPGLYKVDLKSYGITAQLTASERVGFHKYTFPESEEAHIILDMVYNIYHHDNKNIWTFIRVENDSLVTGYRQTKGWARDKKVFFVMQFSKAFKSYGHKKYDDVKYDGFYRRFNQSENFPEMAGKDIRAYFNFDTEKDEQINIKFALSSVSTAGALQNLKSEIPHWNFNKTYEETKAKWNKELSKIDVITLSENDKITFYTAMYHSSLSPILYEDVDGRYRGLDQNIHQSKGFTNYSIFSLWDTYRALHPLFNIIQPKRNNDMIKSMLAHHNESVHNMLPIWSHYANENWCMIGYHATSVIADAMAKDVGDFDRRRALQASINTANVNYFDGLGDYIEYKFVADDKSHSSVSKTLEYAYNDWCIAQMAKIVGDDSIEEEFLKRAEYYKNVFDTKTGYMRPKLSDGTFRKNFDPMDTHGQGFIEGNAWNYGLYVPQNIDKMISMMGGNEQFSQHLDSLFTMQIEDKYITKHEDITRDGIIGNYVHGNEPGHHIPYLYNWTGHPQKTQERVRMIMRTMYDSSVEGLCGNDDAGQMSAWYVFSSLGFYPVTPGFPYYAIGSPLIRKATIHLDNGKTLIIKANNQSEENVFIKSVSVNGKVLENSFLSHQDIINGGEIVFEMSKKPNIKK